MNSLNCQLMNFDSSVYCWTDWFTWVHPSSGHLPCGKRGRQRIWRLVPTILFSCTGLDVGNAQVSHKSQRQIFLNFLKILESEISSQTQFGELSLLAWWSIIADLSDAAETESGIGIIKNSKRWSFVCFFIETRFNRLYPKFGFQTDGSVFEWKTV